MKPRYTYLTRSFVAALGLPVVGIRRMRDDRLSSRIGGAPRRGPIVPGVVFENGLYLQSECGLSFDYHARAWLPPA